MATLEVAGVRIVGVVGAVPSRTVGARDLASQFPGLDVDRAVGAIGLDRLHRASEHQTATDLSVASAERLLGLVGWERASVDAVVMVTQTPDHLLPGSSYLAHGRLGLSRSALAFDVSLGCSGFVYGFAIASRLMGPGVRRVLLLAGDTLSKIVSPQDQATAFLFGDAGTATALECSEGSDDRWTFELGADGTGAGDLIVASGGFRCPGAGAPRETLDVVGRQVPATPHLRMDGMSIFGFSTREVPPLIARTVAARGWEIQDVDQFLLHQANRMILTAVGKKLRCADGSMPHNIGSFGNTAVATIPLLLADAAATPRLDTPEQRVCLAGFGVGLSWAAAAGTVGAIARDILVVGDSDA